jgi:hypothetical protein
MGDYRCPEARTICFEVCQRHRSDLPCAKSAGRAYQGTLWVPELVAQRQTWNSGVLIGLLSPLVGQAK